MSPTGIILSSGSQGATKEAIEKVLADNGYEPEQAAAATEAPAEPKREDFKTEAEFEAAQDAHEAAVEEHEQAAEEQSAEEEAEAERKRLEALPKKTRRQRAVEKATKELNDKLRKAEERLAALEGGKKPNAETKVETPKAPKLEDFATEQEYEDALFDYRYKLRRAKEQVEQQQASLKTRIEANFTDYKDSVAAFREEHDDWDTVVGQSIAIPEAVYYAIVDLGKEGPAVTYHLGQHPELIDDLAELTPYRAAIEIGRLADKLKGPGRTSSAERTQKPRTRIPEPVRPVSTGATTSSSTSREAAQKRDYRAFKAAQRRGA